jgi:hypothetical protein
MKKTLIAFALMVSGSAMAQTNYNTCMNPCKQRKDSVQREIKLNLTKAKVLNGIGDGLVAGAFASAILGYHLGKTQKTMIWIPLGFAVSGLVAKTLAGKYEEKGFNKF